MNPAFMILIAVAAGVAFYYLSPLFEHMGRGVTDFFSWLKGDNDEN